MAQESPKRNEEIISRAQQLNQIEIPKRPMIKGVIIDSLYYIIWEENLLKPKVLLYSFASAYFAKAYAKHFLKGYRYNVLPGSTLLEFGIDYADVKMREAKDKATEGLGSSTKYHFHPELSKQRKKTLRNLYRRNQRRLLRKLLLLKK